ncbi:methenyltetrahydrofolate synthase domain-containing protein isoform X2 [Prorops nasuta]|uniref:methenyltetrahydrofolate synthase domain-containing protein isoform X2 n=1 Tax=Prorops nasuta TaxID=863751 RepID=UPI0034CDE0E7
MSDDQVLVPENTKHSCRIKMWDYMMKNDLVNFPLNINRRIPNFKGAAEAALRLSKLDEFKRAKTIKINPDKPQEPVRFLALEANKEILVPIPRLSSGLFHHVTPIAGMSKEQLRIMSTTNGLQQYGKPLGIDSKIKVDLVVLGSVCVSQEGYRLGKGEGFADLEFAIMMRMGAVNQDTVVISTVHDCQIVCCDLPSQMFKDYDVPVDIIVTPTHTIYVSERLKKPSGIIWGLLSERRLKSMQILQKLKIIDEGNGKPVELKKVNSDSELRQCFKRCTNPDDPHRRLKRNSLNRELNEHETDDKAGENQQTTKKRSPRGKPRYKVKIESNEKDKARHTKVRPKSKSHIEFSLKLSNISSDVRVRDLKNALIDRGVKPNDITWQGYRGVCYLHFSKLRNEIVPDQPIQIDSIMASLRHLQIGAPNEKKSDFIIVEPAKPISRIEVTDVTTV